MNYPSLDKAQVDWSSIKKSNHLVAIKGWHKAPLWTKLRWSSQDHF